MAKTLNEIMGYDYYEGDNWFRRFWDNISGTTSAKVADYERQYQQELNDKMMEREDTAYQRAVEDARKAGLSALSVNGGASANAGSMTTVNDYAGDSFNRGMNLLNSISQFQNNIMQQILSKQKAEADIRRTNAETDSIDLQNDLFAYKLTGNKKLFDAETIDKMRNYKFNETYGTFNGANPYQEYALLNNLNKNQYSDVIYTNEFNKIGLLYGIISKVFDKTTDGKIKSTEDLFENAGQISNILGSIVKNGTVKVTDGVFGKMLKDNISNAGKQSINNINREYKETVSNYRVQSKKEALNVADYYNKNVASKIGLTVKPKKDKAGHFYFEIYKGKKLLNEDQHIYTRSALGSYLQNAYDNTWYRK